MKLKYIMNTEMWVVGAGVFKQGQVVDIEDKKKIKKLLKTGMFEEVKPPTKSAKSNKPKKNKVKKSKKKGVDK